LLNASCRVGGKKIARAGDAAIINAAIDKRGASDLKAGKRPHG
jgi:hypothetical protein